MELLPRAFDLNHRRDNRCSSGAAPCRLLVVIVLAILAILASIASPASASARCGAPPSFTYDALSVARVDVQPFTPAEARPTQLSGSRDESASPSVEARGTPTTPSADLVATEAEAGFPAIKPGAAGGETAGKVFPGSVRQAALEENPSTCVYCHMETDAPQVDHAIPRVQGGNATLENAQTTCGWCNASKGGRTFPVNPPPGYEGAWPPPWWNILGP